MNVTKPLTEARIARLKHDPNGSTVQIHYDPAHTGLGVRLYPSGAKSYVLKYGSEHGRNVVTLGSVKEHTLSAAHEWWREQRGQERRGVDLVRRKQVDRQGVIDPSTVAAIIDAYLADPDHLWSKSHLSNCVRRGREAKKFFGTMRPEDVSRLDIRRFHKQITDRGAPIEANRTKTFLHSLFSWATDPDQGYLPESHPNPAHERRHRRSRAAKRAGGVGRNREHQRQRVLLPSEGEYARLLEAADSTSTREGIIVRLYLLTGLRTNELLQRRWRDVDFKQRTLFIPGDEAVGGSTKNGKDHIVPLCDRAIELLEGMRDPQVVPMPDTPIFPSSDPMKPLDGRNAWKSPWNQVRQEADLRDWGTPNAGFQVKDLRATVSTWLIEFRGYTEQQTGVLLNHSKTPKSVTEQHYHSDLGRKLEDMRLLVNELQGIMKICEDGEEKDAFSTDRFSPALLAANGS